MLESVLPSGAPDTVLIAVPSWYAHAPAVARLTRLLGAAATVDVVEPSQLDACLWSAPGAHALVLHPSAEDFATRAVADGAAPSDAIAAWTRHSAALVLQCRRLAPRITVADPHGASDDDALAESLGARLGLRLAGDGDDPARSREDTGEASVARYLCRLVALESPAVATLAAQLRPHALALWSAPIRTSPDEAVAAFRSLQAGSAPGPAASTSGEATLRHRLAEAEAQNALLLEQIALLQEAVGASIFDTATLQHQTIYADDGLTHPAFYPPERRPSDGLSLRWIGNANDAVLPTDISRTRPIRVDVQLAVVINAAALDGFSVTCDGLPAVKVERTRMDDGSILHSSTFDAPASPDPLALVRIGLHIASKVDLTARGDPRFVAVAIHKIDVWQLEAEAGVVEIAADTLDAPAFYGVEALPDGRRFRWMGRETAAVVPVGGATAGAMRVEVHMPLVIHRRCLDGLELSLDGVAPEVTRIEPAGDGGAIKSAVFPDGGVPGELALSLGATVEAEGRPLGVAIERIVIRPA
ncbi:hypothetical protein [Acuticoccus sediminis]|uniref:hypothetical protein n=1 Tax=Acuticoccus sediminis TaxID=2184697 RepID=UPI001CFCD371|nr:hypothetical protein [Acuticoccus sediminis]